MKTITLLIVEYSPYAIVVMFSGGDDSLTAYHVARYLEIPTTHFLHGVTNTGITETTDFARQVGKQSGLRYIEANAGNAFDEYVLRKGFFGIGEIAHENAYHILKNQRFRATLSQHIRQRKRNRNILLLTGARKQESNRRKLMTMNPIRPDGSNIWVSLINDWTKLECLEFLDGQGRNPVTEILHRSGECLCGTMQSLETRREVSYWFPYWGKRMDSLEKEACSRGFCWKWGEDLPAVIKAQKSRDKAIRNGQLELGWLPMCHSCQLNHNEVSE
jgi:3'-phosphoadenosine 5'-phosphosulfate sulfotransferase (PAPS reductase)/FAD synthetase